MTAGRSFGLALLCAGCLAGAPLGFRTRELPRAAIGAPYYAVVATKVDGRCETSDVQMEVAGGVLPRGVMLAGDTLTGVPAEFGRFRIRVRAESPCASAIEDLILEVTGKPILRVAPEELAIEYREGDPAPLSRVVLVSATWPALPYALRAASAAPWLRLRPGEGATPPEGSPHTGDPVTVEVSPEGLAPGVYRAILSFSTAGGVNAPQIPVTFRVLAK